MLVVGLLSAKERVYWESANNLANEGIALETPYLDMQEFIINTRIQILKVGTVWRNNAVLQCEYCFNDACYSTGSLQMPNVGLD